MGKLLPFPDPSEGKPDIDWVEVEHVRKRRYPKISKKALAVLRSIVDAQDLPFWPRMYLKICHPHLGNSPDPVLVWRRKSDVLWVLDLLDRFGGELSDGKSTCRVRRPIQRFPVFLVQEVSEEMKSSFNQAVGCEYERFYQSDRWRVYGKDFPETRLSVFVVEGLQNDRYFLGWFDRDTALLMLDRLREGTSVEEVMMIG